MNQYVSITPGEHYGYRKSRQLGHPLLHIEVLAKAKPGLWKVKFIDGPNAGLTDYVRSKTIAVAWSEAEALLNDELRLSKLIDAAHRQHVDETVKNAINAVLDASGDWDYCLSSYGDCVAEVPIEAIRRILKRARLEPDPMKLDPMGFIDRFENLNLSAEACLVVAGAFARAEPDTVLTYIEADEQDYIRRYGDSPHMMQSHAKDKAAHALAREWTEAPATDRRGHSELEAMRRDAVTAIDKLHSRYVTSDGEKTEEIQRLRSLVLSAADELRSGGIEDKADWLLIQLNRPRSKSR